MIPLFILKNIIVEISAIIYYNVYNVFFRLERKINMKKKGLIILFAVLAVIGLIIGVVAVYVALTVQIARFIYITTSANGNIVPE